jgi:hypothetical protein
MQKKRRYSTMHALNAWTDESGNSGQNLFDDDQPFFWTATLLSPMDLDEAGKLHHQRWLQSLGATELHGNDLGVARINSIAESLKELLEQSHAQFIFTRIEKQFHAGGKLVGLILDSEANRAVSPAHDFIPMLRRKLTFDLFRYLTFRELKDFWNAYGRKDLNAFRRILGNLQLRVYNQHKDRRAREVLLDALGWAAANPEAILHTSRRDSDSPNILAMLLLLEGIHQVSDRACKVIRFVHDDQNEFGKSMARCFESTKNVRGSGAGQSQWFQLKTVKKFACPIEILPSYSSVGLQAVDVILYLMSKYIEGSYLPRRDACAALAEYITRVAILRDFTFERSEDMLVDDDKKVMTRRLTPNMESLARKNLEDLGKTRKHRMSSMQD